MTVPFFNVTNRAAEEGYQIDCLSYNTKCSVS